MDIDFLWALGGWTLFSESEILMARDESFRRSYAIFWFFLFLFLLPFADSGDQFKVSIAAFTARRLLAAGSVSESMKVNPCSAATATATADSSGQYKVSNHEVPSGPNPVSNR